MRLWVRVSDPVRYFAARYVFEFQEPLILRYSLHFFLQVLCSRERGFQVLSGFNYPDCARVNLATPETVGYASVVWESNRELRSLTKFSPVATTLSVI